MNPLARYFIRYLFWPLFFISHLLMVSLIAWSLLAQIDFAYPTGYKLLNLEAHIQEFAPLNHHKQGFEFTTPQEQWKIFAQIVKSIQHHGEGLELISYRLPDGTSTPLMHYAEIIHLQDVSNLVDNMYIVGTSAGLLWIFLCLFAYRQKLLFPPLKQILLGFLAGIAAISILIISLGATKVFYWFHTKIFPEGHQWFFYYEDSLMTTLMKAPDIFGFIAVLLIAQIITYWVASVWATSKLLLRRHHSNITLNKPNQKKSIYQSSAQQKNKK